MIMVEDHDVVGLLALVVLCVDTLLYVLFQIFAENAISVVVVNIPEYAQLFIVFYVAIVACCGVIFGLCIIAGFWYISRVNTEKSRWL